MVQVISIRSNSMFVIRLLIQSSDPIMTLSPNLVRIQPLQQVRKSITVDLDLCYNWKFYHFTGDFAILLNTY